MKLRRIDPPRDKTSPVYRQIWRVVDAAVADCFDRHPEYLPKNANVHSVRESIVKRVTGRVHRWLREGW